MSVVIPPGYANIVLTLKHASLSRPALVTWGIEIDEEYTDPVVIANREKVRWSDNLPSVTDSNVQCLFATAYVGQDGPDPLIGVSNTAPVSGTQAGESMSPNQSLRVVKLTGVGGRRNKGSFSWPWMCPEGNITESGQIDNVVVTSRQTAFTAFRSPGSNYAGSMVLLHNGTTTVTTRSTGSKTITTVPAAPLAPTPIVALQVQNFIGTQRRRLVRTTA